MTGTPSSRPTLVRAEDLFDAQISDFELLIDSVSDYAISILDPTGLVKSWNKGAELITGYAKDDVLGRDFSLLHTDEDNRAGKPRRALEIADAEGRYEDEGWRPRKDGPPFFASVTITPIRTQSGVLRGFGTVTRDLTKERSAKEELKKSEQRFRLLVDSIRDYAVFMLDAAGNVITWNPGARRLKGYEPHEIIGKHISIFYLPEEKALAAALLRVAVKEGRTEAEGWRVRKDGSRFWANVVMGAIRDESGELIGFTKVTRDMTERKSAEEARRKLAREEAARIAAEAAQERIRESEERYRELSARLDVILRNVNDGISVHDPSGGLVYANEAAARLWGFPSSDAMLAGDIDRALRSVDIFDEHGLPLPIDRLPSHQLLLDKEAEPLLVRVRDRRTGHESWQTITASAVRGPGDRIELAVNVWHDVTAARRQHQAERYSARMSAVLATSLDKATIVDELAAFLVPDLADFCIIHLVEGERVILSAVAHPDPRKVELVRSIEEKNPSGSASDKSVRQVIRSGRSELYPEIADETLRALAKDETHLALLRSLRLRSYIVVPLRAHGRVIGAMTLISAESQRLFEPPDLALAEELGERAGLAIENARLYGEATAAIRLRDEFLSIASHELRTPLTTLDLHLSALTRATNRGQISAMPTDKLGQHIVKAYDQVHRLADLISDLLDVSRVVGGRLSLRRERFDLIRLARDVADRFEHESARAKSPLVLLADGQIEGEWDKNRIDQILTNLITNALKYGGQQAVEIAIRKQGSSAVITVRDRGIGIRPEDQSRIFERFERTDAAKNFGGLGLGLWIVRQVSEAHGGSVTVASQPGKGSTFEVVLPLEPVAGGA
jgi:PAS domain S-box-containing protein